MLVIAMTQEMAARGKDVALGVCEALGLTQVRHEIGDVVAGRIPNPNCVDMMVALARGTADAETPASQQHLPDLALAAHVRAALRARTETSAVDIGVEVEQCAVTQSGIVSSPGERDRSIDVASAVAGVKEVENQLATTTGTTGARNFPSGLAR